MNKKVIRVIILMVGGFCSHLSYGGPVWDDISGFMPQDGYQLAQRLSELFGWREPAPEANDVTRYDVTRYANGLSARMDFIREVLKANEAEPYYLCNIIHSVEELVAVLKELPVGAPRDEFISNMLHPAAEYLEEIIQDDTQLTLLLRTLPEVNDRAHRINLMQVLRENFDQEHLSRIISSPYILMLAVSRLPADESRLQFIYDVWGESPDNLRRLLSNFNRLAVIIDILPINDRENFIAHILEAIPEHLSIIVNNTAQLVDILNLLPTKIRLKFAKGILRNPSGNVQMILGDYNCLREIMNCLPGNEGDRADFIEHILNTVPEYLSSVIDNADQLRVILDLLPKDGSRLKFIHGVLRNPSVRNPSDNVQMILGDYNCLRETMDCLPGSERDRADFIEHILKIIPGYLRDIIKTGEQLICILERLPTAEARNNFIETMFPKLDELREVIRSGHELSRILELLPTDSTRIDFISGIWASTPVKLRNIIDDHEQLASVLQALPVQCDKYSFMHILFKRESSNYLQRDLLDYFQRVVRGADQLAVLLHDENGVGAHFIAEILSSCSVDYLRRHVIRNGEEFLMILKKLPRKYRGYFVKVLVKDATSEYLHCIVQTSEHLDAMIIWMPTIEIRMNFVRDLLHDASSVYLQRIICSGSQLEFFLRRLPNEQDATTFIANTLGASPNYLQEIITGYRDLELVLNSFPQGFQRTNFIRIILRAPPRWYRERVQTGYQLGEVLRRFPDDNYRLRFIRRLLRDDPGWLKDIIKDGDQLALVLNSLSDGDAQIMFIRDILRASPQWYRERVQTGRQLVTLLKLFPEDNLRAGFITEIMSLDLARLQNIIIDGDQLQSILSNLFPREARYFMQVLWENSDRAYLQRIVQNIDQLTLAMNWLSEDKRIEFVRTIFDGSLDNIQMIIKDSNCLVRVLNLLPKYNRITCIKEIFSGHNRRYFRSLIDVHSDDYSIIKDQLLSGHDAAAFDRMLNRGMRCVIS